MDRIFVSKRDRWLGTLLWLGVCSSVIAGFMLFSLMMVVSLGMFLVATLVLSVYYRTFYRITNKQVSIHSGPFHWTVDTGDITEVFPTDNPLSAPACSLDRLRIVSSRRSIMVSPLEKEEFLKTLAAIDDGLVFDGERIKRKQA